MGEVVLSGVPDTALFGHVYPITITNMSNAVRAGFQTTCLDGGNVKCGTFTSASGINIANANGRQYARQSTPRFLNMGAASWTFNWTAPTTATGDKANFYIASLCANNDGEKTGDNAVLAMKTVTLTNVSSSTNHNLSALVEIYPTVVDATLQINLNEMAYGTLNLFDGNGKLIRSQTLKGQNSINLENLAAGYYVARIETEEGTISKKIIKN